MMMHVIHDSISITQYVMERIKKRVPFCSVYALLFKHKGVLYPVEPIQD